MIKIIDKYIIGKFLGTFFFMLGIIMFLAVVFDVSEKLSCFVLRKHVFLHDYFSICHLVYC
jgi:lipopolysaccharide export system permease protein